MHSVSEQHITCCCTVPLIFSFFLIVPEWLRDLSKYYSESCLVVGKTDKLKDDVLSTHAVLDKYGVSFELAQAVMVIIRHHMVALRSCHWKFKALEKSMVRIVIDEFLSKEVMIFLKI